MARTSLPPGFRFHPTDVELVKYHLKRKLLGKRIQFEVISEINIYKFSPWDLPDKSCLKSRDLEWYFFCPKEKKYASGRRTNRATEVGYWKSTGKDRSVLYNGQTVGMVKTLVFHKGNPPKGERTDWVMYEYRMLDKELTDAGVVQDAFVLCKVFQKSGPGPKNGAQYGAPFNEEEWDDDDICSESLRVDSLVPPTTMNKNDSVLTSLAPGSSFNMSVSDPGPSNPRRVVDEVPPPLPDTRDDIDSLLDIFIENSPDMVANDKVENFGGVQNGEDSAIWVGDEIYSGLEDLNLTRGGFDSSSRHLTTEYGLNSAFASDDSAFLELNDLSYPLGFPAEEVNDGSQHFHAAGHLYEPNCNNYQEPNDCNFD